MFEQKRIDVWISLQSDYCYFLLDRLLKLSKSNVNVVIRPVLGLVLRMPEATIERSLIEQNYFLTDTKRTAEFLGLPHEYPDPSPIDFEPGSVWKARKKQPRIKRLYTLFVGANREGKGLEFLNVVFRGLWDGSQKKWHKSSFLYDAMSEMGLDHDQLLQTNNWESIKAELAENHEAMMKIGHWGVPLISYNNEPFYGQDRFDQLLWRMGITLD